MNQNDEGTGPDSTTGRNLQRTIVQVAAVLIAVGVLLKLWRMRTQRADDGAFARLEREVDDLEMSPSGRTALHGVIDYAQELTRQARQESAT